MVDDAPDPSTGQGGRWLPWTASDNACDSIVFCRVPPSARKYLMRFSVWRGMYVTAARREAKDPEAVNRIVLAPNNRIDIGHWARCHHYPVEARWVGRSFGNRAIDPAAALAALHVAAQRSGSSPGAVPDPAASMNRLFEFPAVSDVSRLSFLEVYKGLPELFGWTVCHGESPTPLETQWEEVKAEFDQFITDDPDKVRDHLVESLCSALGAVWTEGMDAHIFPCSPATR